MLYFCDGSEVDRDNILKIFTDNDVPCFSGSCSEVYLEKAFNNTGLRPKKRLPHAKKLGETSLAFLCHPTLSQSDIEHTCEIINSISRLYST